MILVSIQKWFQYKNETIVFKQIIVSNKSLFSNKSLQTTVTTDAAAQITAIHRHHHTLMQELSLKQKQLSTGQSYIDAAPTHVNSRGDMHESVRQVSDEDLSSVLTQPAVVPKAGKC